MSKQNSSKLNRQSASTRTIWLPFVCYSTRLRYVYSIPDLPEEATKCCGRCTIKIRLLILEGQRRRKMLYYLFTFSTLSTFHNMFIYLLTYNMFETHWLFLITYKYVLLIFLLYDSTSNCEKKNYHKCTHRFL